MTPDRPAKADQNQESPSALALEAPARWRTTKVEVLEREEPPRHPGVGVFSPGHPLKGRVFREEGELPTQQVIPQLQDCPLYGQSLFLDGSVVPLSLCQLPVDEQDRVFLTFLYLGQDCS